MINIPRHSLYLLEMTPDKFVHPQPDPEGQWVLFSNAQAAVAEALAGGIVWSTTPPLQDERSLVCEVQTGKYAFRDYINGQWRVGNTTGPAPLAWFKIPPRTQP